MPLTSPELVEKCASICSSISFSMLFVCLVLSMLLFEFSSLLSKKLMRAYDLANISIPLVVMFCLQWEYLFSTALFTVTIILFLWECLNLKTKFFFDVLIHHTKVLYIFIVHSWADFRMIITIGCTAVTFLFDLVKPAYFLFWKLKLV